MRFRRLSKETVCKLTLFKVVCLLICCEQVGFACIKIFNGLFQEINRFSTKYFSLLQNLLTLGLVACNKKMAKIRTIRDNQTLSSVFLFFFSSFNKDRNFHDIFAKFPFLLFKHFIANKKEFLKIPTFMNSAHLLLKEYK